MTLPARAICPPRPLIRCCSRAAARSWAKRAGAARPGFSRVQNHSWVLRHYRRGGLMRSLSRDRYWWQGEERTRPVRRMAAHLPSAPRRIAGAGAHRGALSQARLRVSRRHHHRAPAGCVVAGPGAGRPHPCRCLTWIAIGRCLRRFHDLGVCHADLNAHNILIGQMTRRPAPERVPAGAHLPDRFRSRQSAQTGLLAGRQSGAPASLAGKDHLGTARRALHRR